MIEFLKGLLVGAINQSDPRAHNREWCEHRAPLVWEDDGGYLLFQVCSVCGTIMDIHS